MGGVIEREITQHDFAEMQAKFLPFKHKSGK